MRALSRNRFSGGRPRPEADRGLHGFRQRGLVFLERLENHVAQPILKAAVGYWPQQREAAPLSIDAVLARRKRDIASAALALPHAEAYELQSVERTAGEVQL